MTQKAATLALEEDGDDFTLRRTDPDGTVTAMALAEEDVTALALSAISLQQHILARRRATVDSDVAAIDAIDVDQAHVTHDLLGERILLMMVSPHGTPSRFALPSHVAENLVARIPEELAKMRGNEPTQKQ